MLRLTNLSPIQKITKKYLRATITMREYEIARKGYGEKWRVIIKEVPTHEPPSQVGDASASTTVRQAAAEGPAVVPLAGELSSASGADADAAAREALVHEAMVFGVPEAE
jgi:hypothetical protein